MNIIIATVWILAANVVAMLVYHRVTDLAGIALYAVAGAAIVAGWIFAAWYKVPLTVVGPALGAGFPVLAMAIGWANGEALSAAKLGVLLTACGLVAVATFMK